MGASNADGPKESFAQRARHLSEFQLDQSLKIDVAWYKTQQVHPLISRLLGPVEGTDASRIAECLGLDGSRFAQSAAAKASAGDNSYGIDFAAGAAADVDAVLDRRVRFKSFQSSLSGLRCESCQKDVPFKQMLQPEMGEATGANALFRCGGCGGEIKPVQAQNCLKMQIRSMLRSHCEGWVQC